MTPRTAAAVAALVATVATLPVGGRAFAVAVVLAAGVALLAFGTVLDLAGPRPVLAGAAVAALGVPLRLVVQPAAGLDAVPALTGAMLLAAFVLLVFSARRSDITIALGSTMLIGLVVGLGAGGLIGLRGMQHGFRWALAVVLLSLAPELAAAAAVRLRPDVAGADQAARVVVFAAVAGALVAAADPPMTLALTAATAAICGVGVYAAGLLGRAVAVEADDGAVATLTVRWFGGVLLAAPAAYLMANAVQS